MDEAKLQEIEARANEATPGPWHARTGRTYADGKVTSVEHYIARGDDDVGIASEVCDSRTGDPSADNALFLAAARTDVPALIAEVRRLTAALATVTAERDALRSAAEVREMDMHQRIRAGYDRTIADSWRAEVVRAVAAERDVLRAEHAVALATARREGAEEARVALEMERAPKRPARAKAKRTGKAKRRAAAKGGR